MTALASVHSAYSSTPHIRDAYMKMPEVCAESTRYVQRALVNAERNNLLVEQLLELDHLGGSEVEINEEPAAIAELA